MVSSLTFDLSAFLCDVGRLKVAQILRVSEAKNQSCNKGQEEQQSRPALAFAESLLARTYPDVFYLPQSMNEEQLAIENSIALLAKQHGITAVRYQPWQEISVYSFSLRIQNEILHRSEHPAQLIEIQNKNCRVLAADPAVFELDGIGAPDLAGVDHLILLESPPVDKYPLPDFTNANRVHALYANRAQFDLVGCPFADYCVLGEDKNTAIIQFP